MNFKRLAPIIGALALVFPVSLFADDPDGANTAWIMTSTALVLFMTVPGLSLFYSGLVRSKNVLSVLMQCFAITCAASIVWLIIGYSLAFSDGGNANAYIGGVSNFLFGGIQEGTLAGDIPESVFAMFQMTFAIITPALIVGGFAERMRFSAMFMFSILWLLLVYCSHYPLGLGWWLAWSNGTSRLCGRNRCSHHSRCRRTCRSSRSWQPPRFSITAHASSQFTAHSNWCRHALGWLVRL